MPAFVLVKNTKPRCFGVVNPAGGMVMLKPGVNSITAEDLAVLDGNPHVAGAFEHGELVRVSAVVAPAKTENTLPGIPAVEAPVEEKAAAFDLTSVSGKDAVVLITETYDCSLLQVWAESDSRSAVQRAISKQLDLIKAAGKSEE
jgi:hypothetical protein